MIARASRRERVAAVAMLVGCAGTRPEHSASSEVAAVRTSASASGNPVAAPDVVVSRPTLIPRSTLPCGKDPPEVGGWVEVPADSFTMGKVTDEARLARNLKDPSFVLDSEVFLEPRATRVERFWIGRAEVTNGEYAHCVDAGVCTPPAATEGCGGASDLPVNCVNFRQADRYCTAIGARLPTEAEWELAARGPEGRIFAWGDEADEAAFDSGRFAVGSCRVRDTPTGIHDLAGNGREWTSTGAGEARVSKGMECYYELSCYAFNRFVGQGIDEQHAYLGFRCARSDGPLAGAPTFASGPPATPASTGRKVHWSELIDTFPETKGRVRRTTVCFVDVRFDGNGRAVHARALDTSRPEQPACAPKLRAAAERAALGVKVRAGEGGVATVLPVRITK